MTARSAAGERAGEVRQRLRAERWPQRLRLRGLSIRQTMGAGTVWSCPASSDSELMRRLIYKLQAAVRKRRRRGGGGKTGGGSRARWVTEENGRLRLTREGARLAKIRPLQALQRQSIPREIEEQTPPAAGYCTTVLGSNEDHGHGTSRTGIRVGL